MMEFKEQLGAYVQEIDRMLPAFLPEETGYQKTLLSACDYSVINGGKRLRPLFMKLCYALCGGAAEKEASDLVPFMAAIEMIHSSSLVHDDLPCMDNDRLRRGKPSTWAKFGEDMGTLAGDGMMIYAFETACKSQAPAEAKLAAIRVLAEKTGVYGMIGGQSVDVQMTGKKPDAETLRYIYAHKTGALLEAAFMIGGILAGASMETAGVLERAAELIGMAFQIQDDILDVTETAEVLGKSAGSDLRNEKTTWVTHYGMDAAKQDVQKNTDEAVRLLESVGNAPFLIALCRFLVHRDH